jgi:hypothetical protein
MRKKGKTADFQMRAVSPSGLPVPDGELRPFVGRSRGVIHSSREDLIAPVGEDWEVDTDL